MVVELDGATHDHESTAEYDRERQAYLESIGFRVIRFRNEQIYHQISEVLENLLNHCRMAGI